MAEWFVKLIEPNDLDIELNALDQQGWELYQLFQEPGTWEGLVRYRGVWKKPKGQSRCN